MNEKLRKILKKLDENNLRLKWEKCKLAQEKIEWLGYDISAEGITPQNEKVQAITKKLQPKNLKELRSYLGAVNQLIKFIPNLAQITHGFRDLLKKEGEYNWNEEHDKTFNKIQQSVKDIITLTHFNRNCKLRVICDASKEGIGAMLFQKEEEGWKPIACASRYLSQYESKYSINELELLAVVWSVEHFRNYIYGTQFEVITDHKALISALKSNHGNKTYSSRLTRWIDRLLPFDIQIVHRPGRTMGLVDYLSRHPSEFNEKQSVHNAKELWDSWFTVNTVIDVKTNCKLNQIARPTPQANNIRNESKQPITDEKRKAKLYTHSTTKTHRCCENKS